MRVFRNFVNKENELNIMVEDIDPYITGITEPWAKVDTTYAKTDRIRKS